MSLENRKAELRREIERKARYLESLEAMPDFDMMADGTVLGLIVAFGPSRAYPMIAYKVDGFWFATGKSRWPNGASSDELAEWLMSGGRHLRHAQVIAEFRVETVEVFDLGAALGGLLDERGQFAEASGRGLGL